MHIHRPSSVPLGVSRTIPPTPFGRRGQTTAAAAALATTLLVTGATPRLAQAATGSDAAVNKTEPEWVIQNNCNAIDRTPDGKRYECVNGGEKPEDIRRWTVCQRVETNLTHNRWRCHN
jgi:hypothetical protein